MTERRSYDRDASYGALVSTAMRLFAEHGFAATRIEDIAAAAGYTRGAFYFHFQNKLECFWAVIAHRERLRGDWVAEVTSGLTRETSLAAALGRMFGHFARAEQGVSAWVLVMVDFYQQHRHDSDVQAQLVHVYGTWHANVARFVCALQAAGLVAGARDAGLLATEAFAYVEGLTTHARLYAMSPEAFETAMFDGLIAILGRAELPAQ